MKDIIKLLLLPISVPCYFCSLIIAAIVCAIAWLYGDIKNWKTMLKECVFDWREIVPFRKAKS